MQSSGKKVKSVLPDELQIGRFLTSRSAEIQLLCNEVSKGVSTGKLASQQVTRRMRRRAVSHNPKRLPRRLREAHVNQRNKGCTTNTNNGIGTVKKPSRRWRRRPKNLLAEYNRRQMRTGWLETHIWHAKRFHMTTRWGLAVPHTPTDKCWRQTHRAVTSGSVMWDVSYTKLIEVCGETETLLTLLNSLTQPSTEQIFRFGPGEMSAVLYRSGMYPRGVITSLTYIWRPEQPPERQILWMWVHPGSYQELIEVLKDLFHLKAVEAVEAVEEEDLEHKEIDTVGAAKLEMKITTPASYEGENIRLTLLDNRLNRIRLKGPKSLQALQQCLIAEDNLGEGSALIRYFSDEEKRQKSIERGSLFGSLGGVGSGNSVIGFNVRDPRLTLPSKRSSLKDLAESSSDVMARCELELQESGVWSREVRDSVGVFRLSDHDINTARQTGALQTISSSSVPVLLISQTEGDDDWATGWDLVLPPGWAMPFWMCLVYLGVRVGGQKELDQIQLEAGWSPIISLEDSSWARAEAAKTFKTRREKYYSLPPDKRPNFSLFGSLSPLCRDWVSLAGPGWFMVRDVSLLSQLVREDHYHCQENKEALVQVRLKVCGRGKLSENTMIFFPTLTDLEADNFDLIEPKHADKESEAERKESRKSHQVKLRRLKRHWKRVKSKKTLLELSSVANDSEPSEEKMMEIDLSLKALKGLREIEKVEYKEKNEGLWISNKKTCNIVGHNARDLIGWVVRGGYGLRSGGEIGLGIIKLNSLISLQKNDMKKVLVKQPDSFQFRMAEFQIIQKF